MNIDKTLKDRFLAVAVAIAAQFTAKNPNNASPEHLPVDDVRTWNVATDGDVLVATPTVGGWMSRYWRHPSTGKLLAPSASTLGMAISLMALQVLMMRHPTEGVWGWMQDRLLDQVNTQPKAVQGLVFAIMADL